MWGRRAWSLLPEAREKCAMRWRGYKYEKQGKDTGSPIKNVEDDRKRQKQIVPSLRSGQARGPSRCSGQARNNRRGGGEEALFRSADGTHHAFDGCCQLRQVRFDYAPDDLKVNLDIAIRQHVAKPCDRAPRHPVPDASCRTWRARHRYVPECGRYTRSCVPARPGLSRPRHHKGCASFSTRSRSAGWRARSVTTSTRRCRRSWTSISSPPSTKPLLPGGRETNKSTSLSSPALPLAMEPNIRRSSMP